MANPRPTGQVDILDTDGVTVVGSGMFDGSGNARFNITLTGAGTHTIKAHFAGDSYWGDSFSNTVDVVITAAKATLVMNLSSSVGTAGDGAPFQITVAT
jgi:Bacterial Ig-like domain (group 3)